MSYSKDKWGGDIIVSFTSYPDRINTVNRVLDCLISQTICPDKIILYLSTEQFVDFQNFPDFEIYKSQGFEICWCNENLGPHKKYFYTMKLHIDAVIITVDDDTLYSSTMIEELLMYHMQYPTAVIARRTHLITWISEDRIAPYERWYSCCNRYVGVPRMDLVATGCGGVLYPPHIFDEEIFNEKIFMEYAPYADDMWLKVMELRNNIPVVLALDLFADSMLEECLNNGLCCNQNAKNGNDIQLHSLLNFYEGNCKDSHFLIDRIGQNGKLKYTDYQNDIKEIVFQFTQNFDDQEKVLIYGAGTVAKRLYKVMKKNNRADKIEAFIVKNKWENPSTLEGISVKNYQDYIKGSNKIIIGLWDSKQNTVYEDLLAVGVEQDRVIKLDLFVNNALMIWTEMEEDNDLGD